MLAGIQLGVNEVCQHVGLLGGLAEARLAWGEWSYQANYRAEDQLKEKLEPWSPKIGWKVAHFQPTGYNMYAYVLSVHLVSKVSFIRVGRANYHLS